MLLSSRGGGLQGDDGELDSSAHSSGPVGLDTHQQQVAARTAFFADALRLPQDWKRAVVLAAAWHDEGKRDPRFQAMLHRRPLRALSPKAPVLAKSGMDPADRAAFRRARIMARYPSGMRHEALSARIADALCRDADPLTLHLIASHHGRGRPPLPPGSDPDPQRFTVTIGGASAELSTDETVDLDAPGRFTDLNAAYGRWNLALLEAIVRLAEHAEGDVLAVVGDPTGTALVPTHRQAPAAVAAVRADLDRLGPLLGIDVHAGVAAASVAEIADAATQSAEVAEIAVTTRRPPARLPARVPPPRRRRCGSRRSCPSPRPAGAGGPPAVGAFACLVLGARPLLAGTTSCATSRRRRARSRHASTRCRPVEPRRHQAGACSCSESQDRAVTSAPWQRPAPADQDHRRRTPCQPSPAPAQPTPPPATVEHMPHRKQSVSQNHNAPL
ncbi:CRISPR-associated endonuclease Cas3'' [Actinocorallia sp. A-T 12471]|uniref:CRISPR-associated endonuclease Cas3'' n=1 Tax=Actinocorallia sp. A-T 12471 TaxID=3089813 RepID=UPI0039B6EFA0